MLLLRAVQQIVSIHAPAWGATVATDVLPAIRKFQSTRPRGARLLWSDSLIRRMGFNPRARVGRDVYCPV